MVQLDNVLIFAVNIKITGLPFRLALVSSLLLFLIIWEIIRDNIFQKSKLLGIGLMIIILILLITFSIMMVAISKA